MTSYTSENPCTILRSSGQTGLGIEKRLSGNFWCPCAPKNVLRLRMAPLCVVVGQLTNQYGVGCAMRIWGVGDGFSLWVPLLASVSAISFPIIHVCARTLCMCIICGVQYICRMMAAMSSLSGW